MLSLRKHLVSCRSTAERHLRNKTPVVQSWSTGRVTGLKLTGPGGYDLEIILGNAFVLLLKFTGLGAGCQNWTCAGPCALVFICADTFIQKSCVACAKVMNPALVILSRCITSVVNVWCVWFGECFQLPVQKIDVYLLFDAVGVIIVLLLIKQQHDINASFLLQKAMKGRGWAQSSL